MDDGWNYGQSDQEWITKFWTRKVRELVAFETNSFDCFGMSPFSILWRLIFSRWWMGGESFTPVPLKEVFILIFERELLWDHGRIILRIS